MPSEFEARTFENRDQVEGRTVSMEKETSTRFDGIL